MRIETKAADSLGRIVLGKGVGFVLSPGSGASFPVRVKPDRNDGAAFDVNDAGTYAIEPFSVLEVWGAAGTWEVTLLETANDWREVSPPAPAPLVLIYDWLYGAFTPPAAAEYWVDFAGKTLPQLGGNQGYNQVSALDLSGYVGCIFTVTGQPANGGVTANAYGRVGPLASDPLAFRFPGNPASNGGIAIPASSTVELQSTGVIADAFNNYTAAVKNVVGGHHPHLAFTANFSVAAAYANVRFRLWGRNR